MPVTFLQKALAQTLAFDVSRALYAAGASTCTLLSPSGGELQAAVTATKGPSTTLDGAAASGQKTIPVTATTGINVGDVLWPVNALGQTEPVIVDGVTANTSITARHKLRFTYASADVIASRRLSVAVAAVSLGKAYKNCRARWSYSSSASATHVEDQVVHVSTYAPRCTVTEADVLRRLPQARDWTSPQQPLDDLIASVWGSEVLVDLACAWGPESIISGDSLYVATILRVAAQLCLSNGQLEHYDRWLEEYQKALAQCISEAPRDTDDDGASDDEAATALDVVQLVRG